MRTFAEAKLRPARGEYAGGASRYARSSIYSGQNTDLVEQNETPEMKNHGAKSTAGKAEADHSSSFVPSRRSAITQSGNESSWLTSSVILALDGSRYSD